MAEGHAVARWARRLRGLVGQEIVRADAPDRWSERAARVEGERMIGVESRGKHLLIHLSAPYTVHCHAMMFGSWQVGPSGMSLRKEESDVRLRLRSREREAVFYHGPVMELLTDEELEEHEYLQSLGPDLLDLEFDRGEAWNRLRSEPELPVGAAVLRQELVAGIGNIFKSEGLFRAGLDPRRTVSELTRAEADRIWNRTRPLMRRNVERSGAIVTLPPELADEDERIRYWVYRRRGRPCRECGADVRMIRQGRHDRSTYFCPVCQS